MRNILNFFFVISVLIIILFVVAFGISATKKISTKIKYPGYVAEKDLYFDEIFVATEFGERLGLPKISGQAYTKIIDAKNRIFS